MVLTPEERRQMITDGVTGRVPLKELSREYHYDLKSLKRLVQRAGMHGIESVLSSEPKHYTEEEKKRAVMMLKAGVSQNKVAIEYNVGHDLIRTWKRQFGENIK